MYRLAALVLALAILTVATIRAVEVVVGTDGPPPGWRVAVPPPRPAAPPPTVPREWTLANMPRGHDRARLQAEQDIRNDDPGWMVCVPWPGRPFRLQVAGPDALQPVVAGPLGLRAIPFAGAWCGNDIVYMEQEAYNSAILVHEPAIEQRPVVERYLSAGQLRELVAELTALPADGERLPGPEGWTLAMVDGAAVMRDGSGADRWTLPANALADLRRMPGVGADGIAVVWVAPGRVLLQVAWKLMQIDAEAGGVIQQGSTHGP